MYDIFEVVYLTYERLCKSQRDYKKRLDVSLGKTNKIINKALDLGYIEKSNNYDITDKGMNFLSEHKVDNAIIMAAGFGSRFVPMTYDTPKGLLEVNGEVLIERQIKQLHAVGITDIVIVVGYLKEKFEYLTDKYNVTLVYNPDFSEKNNISSLYHAKKHLKNSYLLTSDIYMEDNLYRAYEYQSSYAVEYYEDYTSEWKVEFNGSGLIESVDPKGGENCWAINGPTFFKEEFSKVMLEEINKIYNKKYAAQWYWEDVYMRNLDKLDLYVKKYPSGTIVEFESLEELREFDKSYLVKSRSDIMDTISKVFAVDLKEITELETLKEGMTNDSFLFGVNGEKYVFRNPGVGTEDLINRNQERDVYNQILPLGISDEVIYLEPEKGYKITKFIHNSRQLDFTSKEETEKAFEIIRMLHDSDLVVEHEFNLREKIDWYLELCKRNKAILFSDFDEIYDLMKEILDEAERVSEEKVLIHADFVSVNFLIDNHDQVTLLDWEYAGMGERYIDLAMNVVFEGREDEDILDLIRQYLKREPSDLEIWKVHTYTALAGFLWALWTQYKQACGHDFGTYGMEQYAYAKKYGRISKKGINKHA